RPTADVVTASGKIPFVYFPLKILFAWKESSARRARKRHHRKKLKASTLYNNPNIKQFLKRFKDLKDVSETHFSNFERRLEKACLIIGNLVEKKVISAPDIAETDLLQLITVREGLTLGQVLSDQRDESFKRLFDFLYGKLIGVEYDRISVEEYEQLYQILTAIRGYTAGTGAVVTKATLVPSAPASTQRPPALLAGAQRSTVPPAQRPVAPAVRRAEAAPRPSAPPVQRLAAPPAPRQAAPVARRPEAALRPPAQRPAAPTSRGLEPASPAPAPRPAAPAPRPAAPTPRPAAPTSRGLEPASPAPALRPAAPETRPPAPAPRPAASRPAPAPRPVAPTEQEIPESLINTILELVFSDTALRDKRFTVDNVSERMSDPSVTDVSRSLKEMAKRGMLEVDETTRPADYWLAEKESVAPTEDDSGLTDEDWREIEKLVGRTRVDGEPLEKSNTERVFLAVVKLNETLKKAPEAGKGFTLDMFQKNNPALSGEIIRGIFDNLITLGILGIAKGDEGRSAWERKYHLHFKYDQAPSEFLKRIGEVYLRKVPDRPNQAKLGQFSHIFLERELANLGLAPATSRSSEGDAAGEEGLKDGSMLLVFDAMLKDNPGREKVFKVSDIEEATEGLSTEDIQTLLEEMRGLGIVEVKGAPASGEFQLGLECRIAKDEGIERTRGVLGSLPGRIDPAHRIEVIAELQKAFFEVGQPPKRKAASDEGEKSNMLKVFEAIFADESLKNGVFFAGHLAASMGLQADDEMIASVVNEMVMIGVLTIEGGKGYALGDQYREAEAEAPEALEKAKEILRALPDYMEIGRRMKVGEEFKALFGEPEVLAQGDEEDEVEDAATEPGEVSTTYKVFKAILEILQDDRMQYFTKERISQEGEGVDYGSTVIAFRNLVNLGILTKTSEGKEFALDSKFRNRENDEKIDRVVESVLRNIPDEASGPNLARAKTRLQRIFSGKDLGASTQGMFIAGIPAASTNYFFIIAALAAAAFIYFYVPFWRKVRKAKRLYRKYMDAEKKDKERIAREIEENTDFKIIDKASQCPKMGSISAQTSADKAIVVQDGVEIRRFEYEYYGIDKSRKEDAVVFEKTKDKIFYFPLRLLWWMLTWGVVIALLPVLIVVVLAEDAIKHSTTSIFIKIAIAKLRLRKYLAAKGDDVKREKLWRKWGVSSDKELREKMHITESSNTINPNLGRDTISIEAGIRVLSYVSRNGKIRTPVSVNWGNSAKPARGVLAYSMISLSRFLVSVIVGLATSPYTVPKFLIVNTAKILSWVNEIRLKGKYNRHYFKKFKDVKLFNNPGMKAFLKKVPYQDDYADFLSRLGNACITIEDLASRGEIGTEPSWWNEVKIGAVGISVFMEEIKEKDKDTYYQYYDIMRGKLVTMDGTEADKDRIKVLYCMLTVIENLKVLLGDGPGLKVSDVLAAKVLPAKGDVQHAFEDLMDPENGFVKVDQAGKTSGAVSFTMKEFRTRRLNEEGEPYSKTTVRAELKNMVRLKMLEAEEPEGLSEPVKYTLTEDYFGLSPLAIMWLGAILGDLPATLDSKKDGRKLGDVKRKLEKARFNIRSNFVEDDECVLYYYLREIPKINLE
ncbi:MAG: hypothetical protein WBB86_06805, partial [Candidatus Omnitrophota bacterium]